MLPSDDNLDSRCESQRLSQLVDTLTIDDQRALSRILKSWEKRDQRKTPREKCRIITEYILDNRQYKGMIRNISPYGAYIESRNKVALNQVIYQSFFFLTLKFLFDLTPKSSGLGQTDSA